MKQPISPVITLRRRARGSRVDRRVKGIVRGRDYFPRDTHLVVYDSYFVVATWHEYSDGVTIKPEGLTSVAICRDFKTALLIYSSIIL